MKKNKIIVLIILLVGAFEFFDLSAMQGEQVILNSSSENNKLNINEHPLMGMLSIST